jgi:hypothetical protein
MAADDADDLVLFQDVRVIRSTGPALPCQIGGRSVWLPRWHIAGKLWCTGDRGKLFVRRWIALDRHLMDPPGTVAVLSLVPSPSSRRSRSQLHLVRGDRGTHHAN